MIQIIPLHKPNTMLARDSTFHLNGGFHHTVDEGFSLDSLTIVVKENSYFALGTPRIVQDAVCKRAEKGIE